MGLKIVKWEFWGLKKRKGNFCAKKRINFFGRAKKDEK